MMMNKIDNSGMGIASLGRDEDNYLAHVARGEMVVPPIISDDTRQRLYKEMMAVGLDPNEYTVGSGMSINPITGQPEFGFLKKIAKSVKKVVKKVAPIAAVIQGPWQPFAALYQKGNAALKLAKGEGGLGDILTLTAGGNQKIFGKGGALDQIKSGTGILDPKFLGESLKFEAGSFASSPLKYLKNIGQGAYEDYTSPYRSLFGGQQAPEGLEPIMGTDPNTGATVLQGYKDAAGNMYSADEGMAFMSGEGGGLLGKIGQGIGGLLGGAGDMVGNIFGGARGGGGLGGLMDGNMGAALVAGLLGKTAYESAKKREKGLAETPLVTMDPLGRYQLSKALGTGGTREEFGLGPAPQALQFNMGGEARQYFSKGGLAMVKELDMRDGGESSGPGTGTSDDIPAMLSDGEFVMTAKAVRGAGSFTTKKTPQGIELIGGGKSSRAKGVKNMRELMNIFEAI